MMRMPLHCSYMWQGVIACQRLSMRLCMFNYASVILLRLTISRVYQLCFRCMAKLGLPLGSGCIWWLVLVRALPAVGFEPQDICSSDSFLSINNFLFLHLCLTLGSIWYFLWDYLQFCLFHVWCFKFPLQITFKQATWHTVRLLCPQFNTPR